MTTGPDAVLRELDGLRALARALVGTAGALSITIGADRRAFHVCPPLVGFNFKFGDSSHLVVTGPLRALDPSREPIVDNS